MTEIEKHETTSGRKLRTFFSKLRYGVFPFLYAPCVKEGLNDLSSDWVEGQIVNILKVFTSEI